MKAEKSNGAKAIWFSDVHLRPKHQAVGKAFLNFVLEQIKIHRPKYVINTGDTFHTKDMLFASMVYLYEQFLEEASAISTVIQLVGNHDEGATREANALRYYDASRFKNVINVHENYLLEESGNRINFVSYCRDSERFGRMTVDDKADHLFGHLDINGFNLGSGWEEVHSHIEDRLLMKYQTVNSGHYHLAQEKMMGDTLTRYIGSPMTIDMGEADQVKRIGLIDLKTMHMESIETNMCFHKRLVINAGEEYPVIPEEELARGVKYQVRIIGTREQLAAKREEINLQGGVSLSMDIQKDNLDRVELSMSNDTPDTIAAYTIHTLKKLYPGTDFSKTNGIWTPSKKIAHDPNALIEYQCKVAALAIAGDLKKTNK